MQVIFEAVIEVGTPVIFGIGVIILVFLPLMTLQGMEGKMFAPLAYTIAIALGISLVLSLTLSPVLCVLPAEGRRRARHLADRGASSGRTCRCSTGRSRNAKKTVAGARPRVRRRGRAVAVPRHRRSFRR